MLALLESELDACEKDSARIEVLKKMVVHAKEYEKYATEMASNANGSESDALAAKIGRLSVEIELEKAMTKAGHEH